MGIIYFLIALLATTIGASAGLGGGVIIKPALDALQDYNVFVIGILSSATVFSMAVVSTIKSIRRGIKIEKTLIALTIGALIGGFLGKEIFSLVYARIAPNVLTTIQAAIIIALLLISLLRNKLPEWHIKNTIFTALVGLTLGCLSAFLGIGGGPINVAVLCMFFAMDIKKAAAGSIFIILFSQMTKLVSTALTTGFGHYDYTVLLLMIPAGILGGFLGAYLNKKLSEEYIQRAFSVVVIAIIMLNVYNIVRLSIA